MFARRKKKEVLKEDPPGATTSARPAFVAPADQPIELGTIGYCNLTPDGRHGDYDEAVRVAKELNKPIFANFVEWAG